MVAHRIDLGQIVKFADHRGGCLREQETAHQY